MFAVERRAPDAPWVLLCINAAHAAASGMDPGQVAGRPVHALLPDADADWACARYTECLQNPDPIRYIEKLSIAGRRQEWDTSLQAVHLSDGRARVIGTAHVLPAETSSLARSALSTIRDQTVEADWHLSRVTVFLESLASMHVANLVPERLTLQAEALAATCRTVSSLLSDTRHAAERIERRSLQPDQHETTRRSTGAASGVPAETMRDAERQVLQG